MIATMTVQPPPAADPDAPLRLLQSHFGHRAFLEGQDRVIAAVLAGEDVLVIMPTGGGKSLCYQLPALALDGLTLVISPLIALMKDQVDALAARRIPATFINSSLEPDALDERIRQMQAGEFKLVYVAPERFKSDRFLHALAPLKISLFAVDEAHCISQWGHDFRPDYVRLKRAIEALRRPPVAALTATATPEVREDITRQLGLGAGGRPAPRVFVTGFARPNLTLAVARADSREDKLDGIEAIARAHRTGIVYCATRKNVERVAEALQKRGVPCAAYHAGLGDEARRKAQDAFMSRKRDVVVATNAFGMGIDRADLRFVVHHDIPGSLEAYYQEAGRAGRDGEPSRCELFFNYADVRTQEFFIEGANPSREIIADVHGTLLKLCRSGPLEMPISEIAEHVVAAENDMSVGSSLQILERAGFIVREYRPGSRTYTTALAEPIRDLDDLPIDYERIAEKRKRDEAKLKRMIAYADDESCRHRFILAYFGDPEAEKASAAGAACRVCDNCVARTGAARLPTPAETLAIQKTLSCIARVNGRYGRARIAQTLAGSRTKEIIDAGLDRLPTHGLLADLGVDGCWNLIDSLIQADCIVVSEGQYPTLSLTKLGIEVMHARKIVPLVLSVASRGTPSAGAGRERDARPPRSMRRRESAGAALDAVPAAPGDDDLFEELRRWRREIADEKAIPPYMIFPDRTLRALARLRPRTMADLLDVPGIGNAKAFQYGRDTLDVIRQHGGGALPRRPHGTDRPPRIANEDEESDDDVIGEEEE